MEPLKPWPWWWRFETEWVPGGKYAERYPRAAVKRWRDMARECQQLFGVRLFAVRPRDEQRLKGRPGSW